MWWRMFWGDRDWEIFAATMKRVFPERDFVEVPDGDPIFHALYDLKNRYGIPGEYRCALAHRSETADGSGTGAEFMTPEGD